MKILPLFLLVLLPLAQSAKASGVSWSSLTFSIFRDSYGNPLNENFRVQLGFFEDTLGGDPFVPDGTNVANWVTQWRVFDEASINLDLEGTGLAYFTSEAWVGSDGRSYVNSGDGPILNSRATNTTGLNYAGESAYIWLYNSKDPSPTTEWFLARMADWVLPDAPDECCDTTPNLTWNISHLAEEEVTPIWGAQSRQTGSGEYTDSTPGVYDLQTFTFIPEPSSLLLAALGSSLLLRRKRHQVSSSM